MAEVRKGDGGVEAAAEEEAERRTRVPKYVAMVSMPVIGDTGRLRSDVG